MFAFNAVQVVVKHIPDDFWTIVAAVGEALAALVAVVGLSLIYLQLRGARTAAQGAADDARRDRTAIVHAHWNDREFRRMLSPVYAFLDARAVPERLTQVAGWRDARHAELPVLPRIPRDAVSPRPCKNDVVHVLSFYEDICQRYNLGELDRLSVATSIGFQLARQFATAAWFIYWQRATRGRFLYTEWEEAVRDLRHGAWIDAKLPLHRQLLDQLRVFNPSFAAPVLCVPPAGKQVSPATAARLSHALATPSALGDAHGKALLRLGIVSDDLQSGDGWNVVLMPRSLDAAAWAAPVMHTLAVGIARRLDGLELGALGSVIERLDAGESFAAASHV